MATIKDVAACAGVSKTLVSRYINGQRGVSAESGALIEAAIEKLGKGASVRGEALTLEEFAELSNWLCRG